jgi:acyltransferase
MRGETKNWANWARAIGIFLVILGHVVLKQETLKTVIYCFHMPLFFLLSGYLDSHGKPFAQDLRKNAKGLLLPYLMFAALTYLPWLLVQFPRHPQDYPDRTAIGWALKPLLGVFFGVGYNTPYSYVYNAPLWFLVCLFWLKTIYSAAAALCRKRALWALPLGAGLIAVLFWVKLSGIDLYLSLDSALMALPFYVLGA